MVKLVHHTAEFGSINFEYLRPVITVGSAEDNDLVLPHPSIRPHHCQITLEDEQLILHPVSDGGPAPEDLPATGKECAIGEQFMLGDLMFEVQHSFNTTVAIPRAAVTTQSIPKPSPVGKQYQCGNCNDFFFAKDVHLIGIEGGRKHILCPKCSRPVSAIKPQENIPADFFGRLKYWAKKYANKALAWMQGKLNKE